MKWLLLVVILSSSTVLREVQAQNGFFGFFGQLGNLFRRTSSATRTSSSVITTGVFGSALRATGYVTHTETETVWQTTTMTETVPPVTVTDVQFEMTTAYETVTERLIATVTTTRKITATPVCPQPPQTSSLSSLDQLRRISWKQIPNVVDQYAKKPTNIIALENSAHYVPYAVKRSIDIESSEGEPSPTLID